MFLLGAAPLLLGMATYSRHKKLASREVVAERSTSTVGTPLLSGGQIFKQWLWVVFWPFFVRLTIVLFCVYWLVGKVLPYALKNGLAGHWALPSTLILIVGLPAFLAALWQHRRYQRLSAKPHYEATLNRSAMKWLLEYDDWDKVKQDGEVPRETLSFQGPWPRWKRHWLVVTNRRVLQFAVSPRERRMAKEWSRSAVLLAQSPVYPMAGAGDVNRPDLLPHWLVPQVNLILQFNTGEVITGICPSTAAAKRTAQLLTQSRASPNLQASHQKIHNEKLASRGRRWHQVLASALVPGLGQWLQDRFVTGTVYFTAAFLLVLLGIGPILWAMSGPKMHVDMFSKAISSFWWLLLMAVSAWDAHHFSGTTTNGASSSPQARR